MRKNLKIGDMKQVAKKRGGKCLSKIYLNAHTHLIWKCAKGHEWKAIWPSIKRGSWCPVCRGVAKKSISDMKRIAKSKGGKCLSQKYINSHTHLLWQCKKGHKWQAIWDSIKRGSWCPVCSRFGRKNISEMNALANLKGGKCLSNEYINHITPLLWECARKHRWEAPPRVIKKGMWCRICGYKKVADARRTPLKVFQNYALSKGGKFLSKNYKSSKQKL